MEQHSQAVLSKLFISSFFGVPFHSFITYASQKAVSQSAASLEHLHQKHLGYLPKIRVPENHCRLIL